MNQPTILFNSWWSDQDGQYYWDYYSTHPIKDEYSSDIGDKEESRHFGCFVHEDVTAKKYFLGELLTSLHYDGYRSKDAINVIHSEVTREEFFVKVKSFKKQNLKQSLKKKFKTDTDSLVLEHLY